MSERRYRSVADTLPAMLTGKRRQVGPGRPQMPHGFKAKLIA